MDVYEATRIVFSRIQSLDSENASKIMGLLLLQDHGDKEIIRLVFVPEALLHSVIVKAKKDLGLFSSSKPLWSALRGQDEFISPENDNGSSFVDVSDDFELHECLSFLDDVNPPADFVGSVHGRIGDSVSNGLGYEDSDVGFGWGQCPSFARGFCKNAANGGFLQCGDHQHGGIDGAAAVVGSPSRIEMMDTCNDRIRSKAVPDPQAPRLAHQVMGGSGFPFSPRSVSLQQSEGQRTAALMIGDDLQKLGRYREERSDLPLMASPASRQIYLTFPADSTFREEDVSNYFSTYGPVQDVRIPYQAKRMFGFVTFLYPETVKSILAKGNPHFVCESRVLVKPYKEKGKVPDKYRTKQTMERDLSPPCGTSTALDSRDAVVDLPFGPRTVYNNKTHDLLWRRKCEEHTMGLQNRRLMNLQLVDVNMHFHRNSPSNPHFSDPFNQTPLSPCLHNPLSPFSAKEIGSGEDGYDANKMNLPESLEDSLPDSPFAWPAKHLVEAEHYSDDSTLTVSDSIKTFNCQMPRLSSMGILAGSGGTTSCRVGM